MPWFYAKLDEFRENFEAEHFNEPDECFYVANNRLP